MPDYSGGAPFLHAQDVEERWLFVGLFVVFIRVAEFLLQGNIVKVNYFRPEAVQCYEVFIGGSVVLENFV